MPQEQSTKIHGGSYVTQTANEAWAPEVKPPFPASLMKEASRQVDLEEAVRWERDRRGLPKDGIDDWKRRSIIYAYLAVSALAAAALLFFLLLL
jgi:hypothetical protein